MAHTNQQRKRIRQDVKQYAASSARRSRVHTYVKKFEESLQSGDKTAIAGSFKAAMQELAKAAQKGIINKFAAARKTGRMAARIKAQSGAK